MDIQIIFRYIYPDSFIMIPVLVLIGIFLRQTPMIPTWSHAWLKLFIGVFSCLIYYGWIIQGFVQGVLVTGIAVLLRDIISPKRNKGDVSLMAEDNENLYKDSKDEAKTDLASQIAGVLSALIPVLAIMGISFDWFTQEWIDNLYILIVAIVTLAFNVYTIIKNHYVTKKEQVQNKVLKQRGLKK